MTKLIPNKNLLSNQFLYIIGNGFDLAHDMKTSYEDFHKWLSDNGESIAVRRLECLYPNIKNHIGRWCDLESALGSISLQKATEYDINYQDCPDEVNGEDSSHNAYQCGKNLKSVVDILPGLLRDWIASISTKDVTQQFEIDDNAKFLSFNYTRTLEEVYHIKEDNVLHIHETVINNRPLVVGYGDALFEKEEFMPDDDTIDLTLIRNILSHNRKPVDVILKEPKTKEWFEDLNEIASVIVYGHSCSIVDKPYFQKVAESIKDNSHWSFYVYDKSMNNSIEQFAQSVRTGNQSFEIINQ